MSSKRARTNRSRMRVGRSNQTYTRFNPGPVKVTKIDTETGEVLSTKTIKDPLSYNKRLGQKYYEANRNSGW
jgi:hypothetical protein